MPRLVHLVRESSVRSIERAGIRGAAMRIDERRRGQSEIERAVFAMPLVPDFSVTYQWVRELRRWHGEKMVAVHFVLPSEEQVLVGRYATAHERLPLRDAVRRVLASPAGNEIIVTRWVRRREIVGIRNVTQLVGWTQVPEARAKLDCVCQVCVPPGTPELVRKLRGEFTRHLAAARKAKTPRDVVTALQGLNMPFERASRRFPVDKLLAFAKAESADVRRAASWLFGYCRWSDVEATLARLVHDPHLSVRECAIQSLVRAGGPSRAYERVRESNEALVKLVDHLEYERDVALSARLLSRIALHDAEHVRARAAEAATTLLRDDDLEDKTKEELRAVAHAS